MVQGSFSVEERNGLHFWSVQEGTWKLSGGGYETKMAATLGMLSMLALKLLEAREITNQGKEAKS